MTEREICEYIVEHEGCNGIQCIVSHYPKNKLTVCPMFYGSATCDGKIKIEKAKQWLDEHKEDDMSEKIEVGDVVRFRDIIDGNWFIVTSIENGEASLIMYYGGLRESCKDINKLEIVKKKADFDKLPKDHPEQDEIDRMIEHYTNKYIEVGDVVKFKDSHIPNKDIIFLYKVESIFQNGSAKICDIYDGSAWGYTAIDNLEIVHKKEFKKNHPSAREERAKQWQIEHAGRDLQMLSRARQSSEKSPDPSTKVGCVIADKKGNIIGVGWNDLPYGMNVDSRINNREWKCARIMHAEVNAVFDSIICLATMDKSKRPSPKDLTLYVWPMAPCNHCASIIINMGIKRVVTVKSDISRWREANDIARDMFAEVGVEVIELEIEE